MAFFYFFALVKRYEDVQRGIACHCEGLFRSNLINTSEEIASGEKTPRNDKYHIVYYSKLC